MSSLRTRPLVTARWVYKQLAAETAQQRIKQTPFLSVLDATHGPNTDPATFFTKHIPTAKLMDQDRCFIPLERTGASAIPDGECFSAYAQSLGVSGHRQVVVYDQGGMAPAARAWWTFRVLGHGRVSVLDGGLPGWVAEQCPTVSNSVKAPSDIGDFKSSSPRHDLVRHLEDMLRLVEEGPRDGEQVVDARAPHAFTGKDPEPARPTVEMLKLRGLTPPTTMLQGHIPGALNLPAGHLLTHDGRLRSQEELQGAFSAAGIDLKRPLVTMCYNGNFACLVALAAAVCGNTQTAVYLGSWTEWGQVADPHHVVSGKDTVLHQAGA